MYRFACVIACNAVLLGVGLGIPTSARAQNSGMPSQPVIQQSSNGLYMQLDGSAQTVDLPAVALGMRNEATALTDGGIVQSFTDPRASGYGIGVGIGYVLPTGLVPPTLSTNARVELDVKYLDASSTQSGTNSGFPRSGVELLNGTVENIAWTCNNTLFFTCTSASSLHAHFTSWQLGVKAASDFQFGSITATPSVGLIGGESDNNDSLNQLVTQFQFDVPNGDVSTYVANVKVHSRDIGGKLGLGGRVPVTDWLSLGAGGSASVVDRTATLSGNDAFLASGLGGGAFSPNPGISSVSASGNTGAFLTDLQADLNLTPMPGLLFRAFAGATFDSAVAGVTSPAFTGAASAPTGSTPSQVKFTNEAGWYIGGGAVVYF